MRSFSPFEILACLLVLTTPAISAGPLPPKTPAGTALTDWLDAFNSDDREHMASYIRTHASWMNLDDTQKWRVDTGGYDLLAIYSSDQSHVVFRVKARSSAAEEIVRIKVSGTEPIRLTDMGFYSIPVGEKFSVSTIDAESRSRMLGKLSSVLDQFYVFPNTAKIMSAALRRNDKRGEYHSIADGDDFATAVTDDLREISHDKHLEVRFSLFAQSADAFITPREDDVALGRRLAATNCAFEKVERLPDNVGYLKFNAFLNPEFCAATATGAMGFVADTDALIVDLRENNGGKVAMVEYISGYLFPEKTRLNDIYRRKGDITEKHWSRADVPGRKFVGKPVFVLTSKRTFSAAEDFAYALKNLKRASLVGEITGGGAHPVEWMRIDDHFSVIVPTGRSVSPITNEDWEGKGVEPDVSVPAAEALAVAQKLALQEIAKGQAAQTGR